MLGVDVMQYGLFGDEQNSDRWEVLEIRTIENNGREMVVYAHTRPKNWIEPKPTTKLPWEP